MSERESGAEVPGPDDLDHLREDVRRGASPSLDRECPTCGTAQTHILADQYPAVTRTGAWGKYLNPVYLCPECQAHHVLALYETDIDSNDAPDFYRDPREADDDE